MKKTILLLLSLITLGTAQADYRYHTDWQYTGTNWTSPM